MLCSVHASQQGVSQTMAAMAPGLAQVMDAARAGTPPQMAVAMRKYRKLRLMLACMQPEGLRVIFKARSGFVPELASHMWGRNGNIYGQ